MSIDGKIHHSLRCVRACDVVLMCFFHTDGNMTLLVMMVLSFEIFSSMAYC